MATSKVKRANDFRFRTLPVDTQLDSIRKSGLYYCDGVITQSGGSRRWGMLIVIGDETYSNGNVKQIYTPNAENHLMTRY